MTDAERARRTGPRALSVEVTGRYRFVWWFNRTAVRLLFELRAGGLDHWPTAPFQIVANHHSGWDPMLVMAASPLEPRITWFGPRERDFSRGFKNRVMAFVGGIIPYDPEKTALTSAVRAVRRVFTAGGVLGIFAEGRIGFAESGLLPFENGAAAFAAASGVPVVPCAIVGSTRLWYRKRVVVRFGEPIATEGISGREARADLERRIHDAVRRLLPASEPALPRRRPMRWLNDLFNGADDVARRRAELGE